MRTLQAVGLDFADKAPFHFYNEAVLPAPPEQVWAVLIDNATWPRWFQDCVAVEWTSPPPHGIGATRDVRLKLLTVQETILAWEPGRRFAFRIDTITLPLVSSMMEDLQLSRHEGGQTHLRWRASYTPRLVTRLLHPLVRRIFGGMFRTTLQNLQRHLLEGADQGDGLRQVHRPAS